ncbi:MAG: LptA/OstA family protein [Candidatus Margulisiibacteriota bacterium]
MKLSRLALLLAVLAIIAGWFYWAIFSPKQDISQVIYQTIKDQQGRADLAFKRVSFEEVSGGEKFWELRAESAVVNKDSGVATLQETTGTFYKHGRPVLKFRSPAALWDMKKKEIFLDKPLGYDVSYERQIATLIKTLRDKPGSLFTIAENYQPGLGYWFQARNLSWKVADQLLLCTGGIVLNKGEITGYADSLRGDVELKRVRLEGNPRLVIVPSKSSPVTFEAASFELDRELDQFIAHGHPYVSWQEATVTAANGKYLQAEKKIELAGQARINYRDISAGGDQANYLLASQQIILTGQARADQGDNHLSSDQVMVSLKEQKISLLGRSKVIINEEGIAP